MIEYYYHPETGEHLGSHVARIDPLETEIQGEEVYLLSGSATFTAPPDVQECHAAIWNQITQAWQIIQDNRGRTAYNTTDKSPMELTALGDLPDGYTLAEPGKFDVWDGQGWQEDAQTKRDICTALLRLERDRRLSNTDWLCLRHRDEQDSGATTTLTADQYAELLTYRRALRDLPATAEDIEHPDWPTSPDGIA